MKRVIVECWEAVMDNRHNPLRHMELETQHYFMQVLGWMWSMVFSLSFLSIFHFGFTWLAHVFIIAGIAMTVAVFRQAEQERAMERHPSQTLSGASRCVWELDSEA